MHLSLGERDIYVRWPSCPDEQRVRANISALAGAVRHNVDPSAQVLAWMEGLPEQYHTKLVNYGLISARRVVRSMAVGELAGRIHDWFEVCTSNTHRLHRNALGKLLLAVSPTKRVRDFTERDAQAVERALRKTRLSEASIHTHLRHLRSIWAKAIKHGFAKVNPFKGMQCAAVAFDEGKRRYVSIDDVVTMARHVPSLLVPLALSRGAGLRVPSDLEELLVGDIDASGGRIAFTERKTKRHSERPISQWAMDLLREAGVFARDPAEKLWLTSRHNLHKQLHAAIASIGRPPLERPFDGMRRSHERDLLNRGVDAVKAAKWTGHTPGVSMKHYDVDSPDLWDLARGVTHRVTHSEPFSTVHVVSERPQNVNVRHSESSMITRNFNGFAALETSAPAQIRTGNQAIMSRLL